jgi:hypothetical protein
MFYHYFGTKTKVLSPGVDTQRCFEKNYGDGEGLAGIPDFNERLFLTTHIFNHNMMNSGYWRINPRGATTKDGKTLRRR